PDPEASAPTVWSRVPRPVDLPAPASDPAAAAPTIWSPVPRPVDLPAPASDPAAAPTGWSPVPRPVDLPAPAPADIPAPAPDQADLAAPAAGQPDEQPVPPLPRRVPGTNGAPPPPAHVRRSFLPLSLLRRRFDPDGHTEPLPRAPGFHAD